MMGDKSNKLSIFVNNRSIWRSRLPQGQKYRKSFFFLIHSKINFYLFSRVQIQLNISSSSSITNASRVATPIAFDGLLTNNAQIQLENILITHQSCPSSKIYFIV
jgi:hypothetical protein